MTWLWIGFFVLVAALVALDLGVLHRQPRAMTLKEALLWSSGWITISLVFNAIVFFVYEYHLFGAGGGQFAPNIGHHAGVEAAVSFFTAYLLEKSLSVDNIFVMALLFRRFAIEQQYQHRVLLWGILGAIVSRTFMILVGVWLVRQFSWLFYVFGAYLAVAGLRMLKGEEDEEDLESNWLLRSVQRVLPVCAGEHGGRFVVHHEGRRSLTRLALALVVIEISDIIFALDSIPAVLAITTDGFIVLTSNIFAILGLRALYFVLASVISQFHYLQLALALVLVVIGAKMALHDVFSVPTWVSLTIVGSLITLGIIASLAKRRADEVKDVEQLEIKDPG